MKKTIARLIVITVYLLLLIGVIGFGFTYGHVIPFDSKMIIFPFAYIVCGAAIGWAFCELTGK